MQQRANISAPAARAHCSLEGEECLGRIRVELCQDCGELFGRCEFHGGRIGAARLLSVHRASGHGERQEKGPRNRRRRRRSQPRSRVFSQKRATRTELEISSLLHPTPDVKRPTTRGDCLAGGLNEERPCPFVSCRFNLYLDVHPRTGSLKLNFPHLEPWEMEESCVLDIADRGGVILEEVGEVTNLTRERVRQLEEGALAKLRGDLGAAEVLLGPDSAAEIKRRRRRR